MLLKGTIFEPLLGLYRLKSPSSKHFSKIIITKIENLAISFYTHIFQQEIRIPLPGIWSRSCKVPIVRESYKDLFYSIGHLSHSLLDFISCIVCLLGENIFSMKVIQSISKVSRFLQDLAAKTNKIRQSIFIIYTKLTIDLNISVERARILFEHYIISENKQLQNLEEEIRVNLQLKQIQEFIERKSDKVDIRERTKRNGRGKDAFNANRNGVINYKDEISRIMQDSQLQIQEEAKINKRYAKYLGKPNENIRKGYFSNEGRKKRHSRKTGQTKLQTLFRLKSKNKSVQQQAFEQVEESRKSEYWKQIIKQMKRSESQKQNQLKLVLSGKKFENFNFISGPINEEQVNKRSRTKFFTIEPQKCFNKSPKKERMRLKNLLPPIGQKENQEQRQKFLSKSRKLCREKNKFILEQKQKAFY